MMPDDGNHVFSAIAGIHELGFGTATFKYDETKNELSVTNRILLPCFKR